MTILELTERIKKIADNIYGRNNIYSEISRIIPEIQKHYLDFITLIPQLNNIGMDISETGVVSQLNNLLTAIDTKDRLKLFDILFYEIIDTLLFYNEINEVINGR